MDNNNPNGKHFALSDITNEIDSKRWSKFSPDHWFPLEPIKEVHSVPPLPASYDMQNVHPVLPFYQHDLVTTTMSHDELASLLPVNHTNNYVDPVTGAHTQTIEGLWRHAKEFLPSFGMRPEDLQQYLGSFMWFRYCKQRKLDMFVYMLKCIGQEMPPVTNFLPAGTCENVACNKNDDDDFL